MSTWNYLCTYGQAADLKQAIEEIATDGFGLELWLDWRANPNAVKREEWSNLKTLTRGISKLSVHTAGILNDLEEEVRLTKFLGAEILVVHVHSQVCG